MTKKEYAEKNMGMAIDFIRRTLNVLWLLILSQIMLNLIGGRL